MLPHRLIIRLVMQDSWGICGPWWYKHFFHYRDWTVPLRSSTTAIRRAIDLFRCAEVAPFSRSCGRQGTTRGHIDSEVVVLVTISTWTSLLVSVGAIGFGVTRWIVNVLWGTTYLILLLILIHNPIIVDIYLYLLIKWAIMILFSLLQRCATVHMLVRALSLQFLLSHLLLCFTLSYCRWDRGCWLDIPLTVVLSAIWLRWASWVWSSLHRCCNTLITIGSIIVCSTILCSVLILFVRIKIVEE